MIDGQLSFDLSSIDVVPQAEAAAIVADFRARYSTPPDATKPRPCICDHPLVFAAELGEGTCGLCGREPRR
jgi:hypothetical protein